MIYFVFKAMGIDLLQVMDGGGLGPSSGYEQSQNTPRQSSPAEEEMRQFVGVVLAETEDTWNGIFQSNGQSYQEPKLVLFSGGIRSACGQASSATGPFYCPGDQKVISTWASSTS